MSLHENNNLFDSLFENFTEGSEESDNYVDSDNIMMKLVVLTQIIMIDLESEEQKELTACVIVDFFDGKFQRCGNKEGNIRQLRNLIGTWQVDRDVIREVDGNYKNWCL
ncbi:uncharacterized protein OCT59_008319 [Rhizophagus irregularis]|uniref:uncharacterized protein n=1 Tax=Rhizophagus irregularis TaxID=588596 RepID=UPI0019FB873D|nr:hypothetical protein OCT59_008319 [Rhizophagus irregularis]GBC42518.2 hypothetical protein GLOIN_2v1798517 [Rhizophagus irregularis DAOM 181602=DAOM 197198]